MTPEESGELIGEELRRRFAQVSGAMTGLIIENEPPLDRAELADMLVASVEGNLETIIQLLSNRIGVRDARPSTVAIRYAQKLAESGVPSDQLRRAYHLGAEGMRREIFGIVRDMDCTPDDKLQILHFIDGFSHDYVDWISGEVLAAYDQASLQLAEYSASAAATVIREVLSGAEVSAHAFENTTRYRLDQLHRASVIRVAPTNPAVDHTRDLIQLAHRIARGPHFTGTLLATPVDRGTAWVWFGVHDSGPVTGVSDLQADPHARFPQVQVSFGGALGGAHGFRRSHEQALSAARVALISGTERPHPLSYDDPGVALASLLSVDMPELRRWVNEELGDLALQTDSAARLRETYSTFLATGNSFTRTGEIMNLHRNTVKYRIDQARSLVGESSQRASAEQSVALHLCRLLGTAVLTPGSPKRRVP